MDAKVELEIAKLQLELSKTRLAISRLASADMKILRIAFNLSGDGTKADQLLDEVRELHVAIFNDIGGLEDE